jgi:hypothetical protein
MSPEYSSACRKDSFNAFEALSRQFGHLLATSEARVCKTRTSFPRHNVRDAVLLRFGDQDYAGLTCPLRWSSLQFGALSA